MDEGVDPTRMCQTLMDKVARSKLLMSVAEPDLLVLFEDWLEELEREVLSLARRSPVIDSDTLSKELGLSRSGANFLLKKLQKEEKL
ncbi:MAG: hypothetical protein HY788_07725 [Deltaproteobacteria bacterium]|nr:hypothetical protein [Deltaproteobacteria bacterium]